VAEDGATECAAVFEEPDGRSTAAIRVVAFGAAIAGDGIATIAAVVVIVVAVGAMAEKILLLKSVELGILARFGWLQRTTIQVARSTGDSVHHEIKTIIIRPRYSDSPPVSFSSKKLIIGPVTIIVRSKDAEAGKRCL